MLKEEIKRYFIVDTTLDSVQLLIMRIIPSENDGFVLILLDFTFLHQTLLLSTNTFQKNGRWFIGRILRDEFSLYSQDRYGLFL